MARYAFTVKFSTKFSHSFGCDIQTQPRPHLLAGNKRLEKKLLNRRIDARSIVGYLNHKAAVRNPGLNVHLSVGYSLGRFDGVANQIKENLTQRRVG